MATLIGAGQNVRLHVERIIRGGRFQQFALFVRPYSLFYGCSQAFRNAESLSAIKPNGPANQCGQAHLEFGAQGSQGIGKVIAAMLDRIGRYSALFVHNSHCMRADYRFRMTVLV